MLAVVVVVGTIIPTVFVAQFDDDDEEEEDVDVGAIVGNSASFLAPHDAVWLVVVVVDDRGGGGFWRRTGGGSLTRRADLSRFIRSLQTATKDHDQLAKINRHHIKIKVTQMARGMPIQPATLHSQPGST